MRGSSFEVNMIDFTDSKTISNPVLMNQVIHAKSFTAICVTNAVNELRGITLLIKNVRYNGYVSQELAVYICDVYRIDEYFIGTYYLHNFATTENILKPTKLIRRTGKV